MKTQRTRYAFPPGATLPAPPGTFSYPLPVPSEAECLDLWERTDMFQNVRDHSFAVAAVSTFIAERAQAAGIDVNVGAVRASALLHDIAKTYSIIHGGNHSQLGGAWTAEFTGNPVIASGVTHHVFWPFELDVDKYFLQLAVLYGDKRVAHDQLVSIVDRYEDLLDRYGRTDLIRERMYVMHEQVMAVEEMFSNLLKVDLNELALDSGRVVQRA